MHKISGDDAGAMVFLRKTWFFVCLLGVRTRIAYVAPWHQQNFLWPWTINPSIFGKYLTHAKRKPALSRFGRSNAPAASGPLSVSRGRHPEEKLRNIRKEPAESKKIDAF